MSEKPISPLRRRMLEDMAVRKFGDKTQRDYIRHVEAFASFLGRSPDTATPDDVRRYQVHLTESGVQPPTLNSSASALRFFFATTLDRAELARHLARVHYPRKLPRVLSPEEVGRLLEAAPGPGLKYKAALSIAYGAGLRAGEVVMLRVSDIDSKRMLIRVELGKGRQGPARDAPPRMVHKAGVGSGDAPLPPPQPLCAASAIGLVVAVAALLWAASAPAKGQTYNPYIAVDTAGAPKKGKGLSEKLINLGAAARQPSVRPGSMPVRNSYKSYEK